MTTYVRVGVHQNGHFLGLDEYQVLEEKKRIIMKEMIDHILQLFPCRSLEHGGSCRESGQCWMLKLGKLQSRWKKSVGFLLNPPEVRLLLISQPVWLPNSSVIRRCRAVDACVTREIRGFWRSHWRPIWAKLLKTGLIFFCSRCCW